MPRAPKFTPAAAATLAPSPRNLFVGTSGWAYPTWRPGFYPADVPPRTFLHYYAAQFTSVEVNYTFRELPTADQLQSWLDATPPGFRFSFKAPQRITHFQRLLKSSAAVTAFIKALAPARDAGKLALLLFQLPPNCVADAKRLARFLKLRALADPALQLAFEFRHASWFTEPVYAILNAHNAALCIAESDSLVTPPVQTASFSYYRLRCDGGYAATKLKNFAAQFTCLAAEREVFVYLKHEDEPTGALQAAAMLETANQLKAVR